MPPQVTPAQLVLSLLNLGLLSIIIGAWAWAIGRLATGQGLLPAAPVRVVPWRGTHVIGMVLLYIAIQLVLPVVLLVAAGVRPERGPGGDGDSGMKTLATILVNASFLIVGPWLLMDWTHAGPADFGIERGKVGRDVLRGVVAWPLLAPIVFGVSYLTIKVWPMTKHPLQNWVERDPSSLTLGLAAITSAFLAPAVEEFLFRGLLLGWLGRWASGVDRLGPGPTVDPDFDDPTGAVCLDSGPLVVPDTGEITPAMPPLKPGPLTARSWRFLGANVAVSLLFAAMHAPVWPTPVPLFFLSLGLGVLYQRTGGLVAPIALHATFNAISTLLFYLSLQLAPAGLDGNRPAVPPPVPPDAVLARRDVDVARQLRMIGLET